MDLRFRQQAMEFIDPRNRRPIEAHDPVPLFEARFFRRTMPSTPRTKIPVRTSWPANPR